jgi:hypothetical protein
MMLNMDPPQHTRQRASLNRGFTPRMIGRLDQQITEICHTLLNSVEAHGTADSGALTHPRQTFAHRLDPDEHGAQIDLIGCPQPVITEEPSRVPNGGSSACGSG